MSSYRLEAIHEAALELGVDPSFVEKDYFAVRVLHSISKLTLVNADIVFTGGTSLSKAYGLIQRFSEDLDFRIRPTNSMNKRQRRDIRKQILDHFETIPEITLCRDQLKVFNESRFFSVTLTYPRHFPLSTILRNHLLIEFSFEPIMAQTESRKICSFIAAITNLDSFCTLQTLSPVETGANKYSALLWRMHIKDRQSQNPIQNDPNLVRHLHDLSHGGFIVCDVLEAVNPSGIQGQMDVRDTFALICTW